MDICDRFGYTPDMALVTFDQFASLPVARQFYWLLWRLLHIHTEFVSPHGQRIQALAKSKRACAFCRLLQEQPGGLDSCLACDHHHREKAREQGKPLRYRCHVGLREFIIPISLHGEWIAFLQCGQMLDAPPRRVDWRRTRGRLAACGLSPRPLEDAYFRIPVLAPAAQKDLMTLLEVLANHIAHAQWQKTLLEMRRFSRITERAQTHIRTHLSIRLPLDELASVASTSKRNLTRVFRAETGKSVVEFIHEQRLNNACDLLSNSGRSCAQIAFECGFGSVQQFNRVFRRAKACTPTAWRKDAELRGADVIEFAGDVRPALPSS